MEKDRKGGIVGVIITIIILILLVVFTNTDSEKISIIENIANNIVMPIAIKFCYNLIPITIMIISMGG